MLDCKSPFLVIEAVLPSRFQSTSDFGPEYVREDFPYKFGEDPVDENAPQSEEEDDMNFWDHIEKVEMKDSFCFALVNNAPPCMCGSGFVGFIGICQHTKEEYRDNY